MPHQTRVILELEPDSAQISGSLTAVGAPPRSFYGWLEVMAALEGPRDDELSPPQARAEEDAP